LIRESQNIIHNELTILYTTSMYTSVADRLTFL